MQRRSLVHSGSVPPPVRFSEVFCESQATSKKAVVPRQLNFSRNPSRTSFSGKPQNFRASANFSRGRISLSGRANQDVSVMDGVSLLSQTITENPENVVIQEKQDFTATSPVRLQPKFIAQVTKPSLFKPKHTSQVKKEPDAVRKRTLSSSNSSSSSTASETKIQKPKIYPTKKTVTASVELNSTAAFEGEEIAALTSTPHPDRKSKSVSPSLASVAENSELAEQMKLFIMDQRNLMQTMKLSFQKMNSVMDGMNGLVEKLSSEVGLLAELKLTKSEPLENVVDSKAEGAHQSSLALNDDKENVCVNVGNARKSLAMFTDMKCQLNCLKTPTVLRTRPLSTETPNTVLSNVVHKQLENLYETSETDD